ncbi:hypothetical protein MH120_19175, partial [Bacillus altitudinis]
GVKAAQEKEAVQALYEEFFSMSTVPVSI